MNIHYFINEEEYISRSRDIIPRIGEKIKLESTIYKIVDIIWMETFYTENEHVRIFIEKL